MRVFARPGWRVPLKLSKRLQRSVGQLATKQRDDP